MQILMKVQKSNIVQFADAIFAQIMLEKINLIAILKIVQVIWIRSIILISKVC